MNDWWRLTEFNRVGGLDCLWGDVPLYFAESLDIAIDKGFGREEGFPRISLRNMISR